MAINALDLIDEQLQKAAAPKTSGKPLFLFLKPDEKFLIRPLFDLKDSVVLMKHNLWSEDPNKRVNAICAQEEGKACLYCQQAQDNKKIAHKLHFYLPIFVYKGVNQKTQKEITYEETQEDGSKITKPIKGFRLLELAAFGTVGDILKWFREYVKEEECSLTACDFSLSQVGEGTSKSFVLMNKSPKPMSKELVEKVATITAENVKARVLEARAPFIAENAPLARGNGKDTDPALEAVKVPQSANEEAFDDTIADF